MREIPELPDVEIDFDMIKTAMLWCDSWNLPGYNEFAIVECSQSISMRTKIVAILTLQMREVDETA